MSAKQLWRSYSIMLFLLAVGLLIVHIESARVRDVIALRQRAQQSTTADARSLRAQAPKVIPRASVHFGIIVETADGKRLKSVAADQAFNPASVTKIATAYFALQSRGKSFRFKTSARTGATVDKKHRVLNGDIYIDGDDPTFGDDAAASLAKQLRHRGIRKVNGRLIVCTSFTYNRQGPARSGIELGKALKRNGVHVVSGTAVSTMPAPVTVLASVNSASLRSVLKYMLCHSDNYLADRLGRSLGGPKALRAFLVRNGLKETEVSFSTNSGLGVNRMTPDAAMKILRQFEAESRKQKLRLSDLLPVAGVDPGTLRRRYGGSAARGAVIAKTGTLTETDGGASALVGVMRTRNGGVLYFVCFGVDGNPYGFKTDEDALVLRFQYRYGGPKKFAY